MRMPALQEQKDTLAVRAFIHLTESHQVAGNHAYCVKLMDGYNPMECGSMVRRHPQNLVDCPAAITAALSHPPPFTTRSVPLPPDRLVPLPPRPLPAGAGAVPRGHRRLPDGPAAATQQHAGPRRHDDASPVLLHEGWPTSSPPQPPPLSFLACDQLHSLWMASGASLLHVRNAPTDRKSPCTMPTTQMIPSARSIW